MVNNGGASIIISFAVVAAVSNSLRTSAKTAATSASATGMASGNGIGATLRRCRGCNNRQQIFRHEIIAVSALLSDDVCFVSSVSDMVSVVVAESVFWSDRKVDMSFEFSITTPRRAKAGQNESRISHIASSKQQGAPRFNLRTTKSERKKRINVCI